MLGQAVLQPVLAATTEWPQAPPRQLISFLRIVIESARVSFTLNSASHLAWGSYSGLGALDCCKYSSSIIDAIDGRFVKRPSYLAAKSSNLRLMNGSALSASARQCAVRSLKNSLSTKSTSITQRTGPNVPLVRSFCKQPPGRLQDAPQHGSKAIYVT
jgi:hypothetical protein